MMEVDRSSQSSRKWSILALLSLAFVINYVDRQVVFSIFPLLRRELQFSDAQLGLAGSLFTWSYALAMPPCGRLADVFSRRTLVVASLVAWSIATLGTGFSHNATEFFLWRIVMGISEALYVPSAIRLITDAHRDRTRSRALSIHGFGQFTGITLGGWYGGWAGEHIGWRNGFLILAAAGLFYSILLAWGLRHSGTPVAVDISPSGAPLQIFRSPRYVALASAYFAFCAVLWMLYAWLPDFIYEHYHLSLAQSGLTGTLFLQASCAVGALLGGWIGDHAGIVWSTGRFRVAIAGLLACTPLAFAIFETGSLLLLKVFACGFGLTAGLFIANAFSAAYDTVPSSQFGFAAGVMNMIGGLGSGLAILAAGLWRSSVGMNLLMLYAAVATSALAIILLAVVEGDARRSLRRGAASTPPSTRPLKGTL